MHQRNRGLSLLEMQISLLLLLLVTLYVMTLFLDGQRHSRRAIEYSQSTILAQRRLEEARALPWKELQAQVQQEPHPFEGFETRLRVEPYEGTLAHLEVRVTAPSGATASISTLVKDTGDFSGVVSDPYTHLVAWVEGPNLRAWNDLTRTAQLLAPVGDSRELGALAGLPGTNLLWRGGRELPPVTFSERLPNPNTWNPPLALPVASPDDRLAMARFNGMVSDHFGNDLVVADSSNRGLWWYQQGAWHGPLRPEDPWLGRPSAITADAALTLIWVADEEHRCLRKLLCPQASSAYPAGQLESAGSFGSWHRTRFRPPAGLGFGSPAGLAMDPQGHALFVHDRARIYRFIEAQNLWEVLGELPSGLRQEVASGMATDRFGGHLFLNTLRGTLWKVRVQAGLTTADFQRLSP